MVEKEPIITTVLPTYRRPELLCRAIESALNQTFPYIRVAVFDNCSNDLTEQVMAKICDRDKRVSYYRHSKPVRAVENFQYGLAQVKTPFVSILADDDYLLPLFYEIALSELAKYPQSQFFVGSTLDATEKGKILNINACKWPAKKSYLPQEGLLPMIEKYVNWTGTLFRTQVFKEHSLSMDVKAIDYDFMLRLTAKYPFILSKQPCACFTHHARGYSSFAGLKLVWPSYLKIKENIQEAIPAETWPQVEKTLQRTFQRMLFGMGCKALKNKSFEEVRKITKISLTQCGQDTKTRWLERLSYTLEYATFLMYFFTAALYLYRSIRRIFLWYHDRSLFTNQRYVNSYLKILCK